jgi:hypothetical protein
VSGIIPAWPWNVRGRPRHMLDSVTDFLYSGILASVNSGIRPTCKIITCANLLALCQDVRRCLTGYAALWNVSQACLCSTAVSVERLGVCIKLRLYMKVSKSSAAVSPLSDRRFRNPVTFHQHYDVSRFSRLLYSVGWSHVFILQWNIYIDIRGKAAGAWKWPLISI